MMAIVVKKTIGMESPAAMIALKLPKNNKRTSKVYIIASRRASSILVLEVKIRFLCVSDISNFMFGYSFSKYLSAFLAALETSKTLPPGAL